MSDAQDFRFFGDPPMRLTSISTVMLASSMIRFKFAFAT
jgi:hypothetical protein